MAFTPGAEIPIPPTAGLGGHRHAHARVVFVDGRFVRVRNPYGEAVFTLAQLEEAAHAATAVPPDEDVVSQMPIGKGARNVGPFTPVTDLERRAIAAIAPSRVTYPPATAVKRFAGDVQHATAMTERQRAYLWFVAHRFRRQIADRDVLAEALRIHQETG